MHTVTSCSFLPAVVVAAAAAAAAYLQTLQIQRKGSVLVAAVAVVPAVVLGLLQPAKIVALIGLTIPQEQTIVNMVGTSVVLYNKSRRQVLGAIAAWVALESSTATDG